MAKSPFLSVIIPSYNERRNFERGVLDEVVTYLGKQKYDWEVIFTDDGSTDGTIQLLKELKSIKVNILISCDYLKIFILAKDQLSNLGCCQPPANGAYLLTSINPRQSVK
jgi:glycosyltransferase involved in cell wall biosynthesis